METWKKKDNERRGLQSHQGKEVSFSGSCFMIEKCSSVSQLHLPKNVTASKNLLYNTGTSTHYSVMTNMGKESKQGGYLYN